MTATLVALASGSTVPVPVSRQPANGGTNPSTENLTLAFDTTSLPPAQYVRAVQGHTPDGKTIAERAVPFEIVQQTATLH